jgi:ribosomal protein S18 acetylase RimI-like enzyme
MQILNSSLQDLDFTMLLYDQAIAHQAAVSDLVWKGFDIEMVKQEIFENRQWKIVIDGQIACVFMIANNDPDIWDEKDKDTAIYIHRISTNNAFRGYGFVKIIADWAINFAKANQINFVRLDTWQDNPKLHALYLKAGFQYMGIKAINPPTNLPKHYWGTTLGLFEIKIV